MINAGDIEGAIETSGIDQLDSDNLVGILTNEFKNKLHNKRIELTAKRQMNYSSQEQRKKL